MDGHCNDWHGAFWISLICERHRWLWLVEGATDMGDCEDCRARFTRTVVNRLWTLAIMNVRYDWHGRLWWTVVNFASCKWHRRLSFWPVVLTPTIVNNVSLRPTPTSAIIVSYYSRRLLLLFPGRSSPVGVWRLDLFHAKFSSCRVCFVLLLLL